MDLNGYGACGLTSLLFTAVSRLPTPVQTECVPLILGGGDVMAVSIEI